MDKYLDIDFWKLYLILLLPLITNGNICVDLNETQDQNEVTVKVDTKRQKGVNINDLERAKIVWRRGNTSKVNLQKFHDIFESYNITRMQLQIRTDATWKIFHPEPSSIYFQGFYLWTVPRVPCIQYDYRIIIPPYTLDHMDLSLTKCFATRVTSLPPSSSEEMKRFSYYTEPPTDLKIDPGENSAKVTWRKSQCADRYAFYVQESSNNHRVFQKEIIKKTEESTLHGMIIPNLNSCRMYDIEVFSKLAGGDINKHSLTKKSFYTRPRSSSLDNLDLKDVSSGQNSILLNFLTFKCPVQCFFENNATFTVETCDKYNRCVQPLDISHNNNGLGVTYEATSLKPCKKYFIKLHSTYPGLEIKPRYVPVITKFDLSSSNVTINFQPSAKAVKFSLDKLDCIETYTASYRLAEADSTLMVKHGEVMGDRMIIIKNLQPNSAYKLSLYGITSSISSELMNFTVFQRLQFKTGKLNIKYLNWLCFSN